MMNGIFYDPSYAGLAQGISLPLPRPGCPLRPLEDLGGIDNGEANFFVALNDRQAFLDAFSPLINERLERKGFLFLFNLSEDEARAERNEIKRFIDAVSRRCLRAIALIVLKREGFPLENRYSLANAFYLFAQLADARLEAHLPNRGIILIGIKRVAPGITENTERVIREMKKGLLKKESPVERAGAIASRLGSHLEEAYFSRPALDRQIESNILRLKIPDGGAVTLSTVIQELEGLQGQIQKIPGNYTQTLSCDNIIDSAQLVREIDAILDRMASPLFAVRQALGAVIGSVTAAKNNALPGDVDVSPLQGIVGEAIAQAVALIRKLRSKEMTVKLSLLVLAGVLAGAILGHLPFMPACAVGLLGESVLLGWYFISRFLVRKRVRAIISRLQKDLRAGVEPLREKYFFPAVELLVARQVLARLEGLHGTVRSQCAFIEAWAGITPQDAKNRYFHPVLDDSFSIAEHDPNWKRFASNWKDFLNRNPLDRDTFAAFLEANREPLQEWLDSLAFQKPGWFAENKSSLKKEIQDFGFPFQDRFPALQTVFAIPSAFPDFIIPDQMRSDFALLETKLDFFHVKLADIGDAAARIVPPAEGAPAKTRAEST